MTWRTLVWMVLATMLPFEAQAQSVTVRSGEHIAFTRIVLDLPDKREWSLQRLPNDNAFRLALQGRPVPINTDSAFDKIDRRRVATLQPAQTGFGLDIGLACDCEINAFRFSGTMLVLDVSETDDPAQTAPPLASANTPSPLTRLTLGPQPSIGPVRTKAVSLEGFLPKAVERVIAPSPEPERAERQSEVDALSRSIAQSVANAATRGILDAAQKPVKPITFPDPQPTTMKAEAATTETTAPAVGIDGDFDLADLNSGRVRIGGSTCVPADQLDVQSWASDAPLPVQLSEVGQALTGEFDRLDPSTVRKLTQLYLHFGFGAEAVSTNGLSPDASDAVLGEMGLILDEMPGLSGVFRNQTNCETPAALWAVLANAHPVGTSVNAAAIQRAFEDLPLHLRAYLGPRLADRLSGLGESELASTVLRRLQRAKGETSVAMQMSQARIDLAEGAIEAAQASLEDLARNSDALSPEAVVAISNLSVENDAALPEDIVELADAYATELRGTQSGGDLWLARMRGWIDEDRFADVFAGLDASDDIAPETRVTARDDAVMALVEDAPEVTFLKHVLNGDAKAVLERDRELALDAADRMLGLGLPDEALRLTEASPGEDDRRTKMIAARALLALSRPEDAEIRLIGLGGDDALRLRTEARVMMGDYAFAQTALTALGESAPALDAAWIAGDFRAVAEADAGATSEASRLVLDNPAPTDPALPPTLSGAQSLADDSETMRATLDALLEETRVSPEDTFNGS